MITPEAQRMAADLHYAPLPAGGQADRGARCKAVGTHQDEPVVTVRYTSVTDAPGGAG